MPKLDIDEVFLSGRWQLALVVVGYFLVVYATNRVLITSPVARNVLRDVRQEEANLAVLGERISPPVAEAIKALLYAAKRSVAFELPGAERWQWRFLPNLTLAKVLTARRYLHGAQELRVESLAEQHLALARLSIPRLLQAGWPFAKELAERLEVLVESIGDDPANATPEQRVELAVFVTEALKLWFAHEDERLDASQDAQRRAMWLVCVGLGLVLTLGFAGHRPTLLFGALGGFLSPLTLVRQRAPRSKDYATSWGPILLSPVAGALTAFAGLLVLEFLSHEKIGLLGAVFHENAWSHPTTATALAFAVLLGFSARLFSGLALAAAGAMNAKSTDQADDGAPDPA